MRLRYARAGAAITDLREYVRALVAEDAETQLDQAYFHSPEWQAQEREADDDIHAGRVKTFDTMEAMLADLDSDDE